MSIPMKFKCDRCWEKPIIALVVASILAANGPSHAASEGTVTIRVNYSNTLNRLRPDPRDGIVTNHSLTVVLSGNKNVDEKWDSRSGKFARQSASLRVLGGSDSERGGQWRVVGPERLVRQIDYPQNSTIITITVTGEKSCQATISYVLKPGYREFTFRRMTDRQIAYYSGARAISSSCQIE